MISIVFREPLYHGTTNGSHIMFRLVKGLGFIYDVCRLNEYENPIDTSWATEYEGH